MQITNSVFTKFFIFLILIPFLFFGCKSSFPRDEISKKTQTLIKKEVGYESKVFLKGATLYIFCDMQNAIGGSLAVSREVFQAIQNISLISTNVALSTDAKIDFFCVVIIDSATGVQIIFKQYIDDVKRWFYGLVSREDFFSRSITDIKTIKTDYVLNKSDYPEILMPEFILEQTVYRMKNKVKSELETLEAKAKKFNKKYKKIVKDSPEFKEILQINQNMKNNKFFDIYLTNGLNSKKYVKKENNKFVFEYKFKNIDETNFFQIDYAQFFKRFADTNLEICEIYKFKKYNGITIFQDDKIFYSKLK